MIVVTVRSKIPVKRFEAIISQWSSQSLLKLTVSLHFEPIINTKLNLQVADSSTFFTHYRIRVESIHCNIVKIRMSASTSQIASCGLLSRNCCAVDRGRVKALGDCCAVDRRGVKRRQNVTYLYADHSTVVHYWGVIPPLTSRSLIRPPDHTLSKINARFPIKSRIKFNADFPNIRTYITI